MLSSTPPCLFFCVYAGLIFLPCFLLKGFHSECIITVVEFLSVGCHPNTHIIPFVACVHCIDDVPHLFCRFYTANCETLDTQNENTTEYTYSRINSFLDL